MAAGDVASFEVRSSAAENPINFPPNGLSFNIAYDLQDAGTSEIVVKSTDTEGKIETTAFTLEVGGSP